MVVAAACAAPPQPLFANDEPLSLHLVAPFPEAINDRYGESSYHPGRLAFEDTQGRAVRLDIELRPRGKTRRRRDYCDFPPLRLRFGDDVAGTLFEGQRTLKLVTHCNDKDSYDQFVVLEYLAYRIYNLLSETSLRARLVGVAYQDEDGRLLTTRFGILLEHWRAVAARNGLVADKVDGAVNVDKLNHGAANRVAVFQYLIGNQDWSLLWPEPDENCCHNVKPLLAPDGTVVPLPYDFDFSGLVNAPYATAKGGSDNVRLRRYGGLCATAATAAELDEALAAVVAQREAIHALFDEVRELEPRRRKSALNYLERFYRVIEDPRRVQSRMVERCKRE